MVWTERFNVRILMYCMSCILVQNYKDDIQQQDPLFSVLLQRREPPLNQRLNENVF